MVPGRRRDENVCGLGGGECHKLIQVSLPWAYIELGSFWRLLEWEKCGRLWRSLEESTQFYTMAEGMRGVQGFLENSRSLLYILVPRMM